MSLDVAIAGQGPVALMLAIQLQSRGIRWRRFGGEATASQGSGELQLCNASLDAFDRLGLLHEVADCRQMDQLQQILECELTRRGADPWRSDRLLGFERNFSGVEIESESAQGSQTIQCRYLIGCDGPSSPVRQRLGLTLQNERRQSEHYRQGNVFLAGEAAHELGLDQGLEDVLNLGWKLASVLRGDALDGLLDSYQEERRESPDSTYRGGKLAQAGLSQGQRGAVAGQRLDPVIGLTRPGLTGPLRLQEFLRHGDFQLIGFGGDWDGLAALADHLAGVFGNQFHCLAIAQPEGPTPPGSLTWMLDGQKQALQAWGAEPGAILVRPDGYVGWRGQPVVDDGLDRFLSLVSLNLRA